MKMTAGENRARYEEHLSRAHRAIWAAQKAAERLGDEGAEQDLSQLLREVSRLATASLSGKARRLSRPSGQMTVEELLCVSES
jgi:hypothetical protein